MGSICIYMAKPKNSLRISVENVRRTDYLGNLVLDVRIIETDREGIKCEKCELCSVC
jgi:hypothetical protein